MKNNILLAVFFVVAQTAAAQVPPATVSGPMEAHHGPQGMLNPAGMDLAAVGYIEQEFFIEGTANRYSTPELSTGEIIDSGHDYRTRFIVRRPQSAENFNGVLVVEWNNVTAGRDLDIDWWQSWEYLVRNGYAFIAASSQRVGVNHLRQWNPERYGRLDVTAGGTVNDDSLSYDIFSAITRAAMEPGTGPDVLGGLQPEIAIATGHSQSAARLGAFVNHVHGLDPVFDGFMIHGGGGRLRDDQDVRIFSVMAEGDMAVRAANPQPDSHYFRHWEVAGSSHVDIPFEFEFARMLALETGEPMGEFQPREQACERPPYSHVPFRHAMNAAFHHLHYWIKDGRLPPRAPAMDIVRAGPPVQFARDSNGNVLGGIRLATHAVPTASNTGMNTGDGFCRLYGSHEPFDDQTLRTLYPDHATYVNAVREVVRQNIADGFILPEDGEQTIREAEVSTIGRW